MIGLGRTYEEKRNFIRMNLTGHCHFHETHQPAKQHVGVMRNLSGTGMLFETASELQLDNELMVTLNPTPGQFDPLQARAQIVRIESLSPGYYVVACKIVDIA